MRNQLILALAATVVTASPLSPREIGRATYYTSPDYTGSKSTMMMSLTSCYNFKSLDNQISSIDLDPGMFCTYYKDHGCQGANIGVYEESAKDLRTLNFDNMISSAKCVAAASCYTCYVTEPSTS